MGDETARRTDTDSVKDTQGSPNDPSRGERMEIEEVFVQGARPSAVVEDVHMEALDLGGNDDDTEPIQQTQASQAVDLMETEATVAVDVTNERSLIAEVGAAARLTDEAPPPEDEVTHL